MVCWRWSVSEVKIVFLNADFAVFFIFQDGGSLRGEDIGDEVEFLFA